MPHDPFLRDHAQDLSDLKGSAASCGLNSN